MSHIYLLGEIGDHTVEIVALKTLVKVLVY
jgi:hypothetical protein